MTWHKFCSCGRILTIEEMSGNICSKCKEEQVKEVEKKEESND
jgi:hypothetical protein